MKLTLDTNEIAIILEDSKGITLRHDAEDSLLKLIEIKRKIDEAWESVHQLIDEEAKKVNENWAAIKTDRIKIIKYPTGQRYMISDSEKLPKGFLKERVISSLDISEVDSYVKSNDSLPPGVSLKERNQKVDIKVED